MSRARSLPQAAPDASIGAGLRAPAFDLANPETQRILRQLKSRGAADDISLLCLGMSRLETIIRNHRGRRRHVFFASFPKSGTTYLHRLLLAATGFVDYLIDRFSEDQQQNIIRQWMPMFLAQDTVTQIHMFATAPNTRMLRELGVRPAVLVRDLMDTLVSLRDHLVNEDHIVPMAQVPIEFRTWPSDEQMWFLVRMVTPWYLNFLASWQRAAADGDVLWVRYEELVASPVATVMRVLEHARVEIDEAQVRTAAETLNPRSTRFNVGVSGRGRTLLSEAQQEAVRQIARLFHGAVDFSLIGL